MASPNWAVRSPPCPTLSCSERAERNGHAAVQADLPRALRPESWPPRFPFAEVPSDRRAVAARRHRGSKRLFAAGARPGRRHPARAYARLGAEAKNGNIDAERRDEARSALLARVCEAVWLAAGGTLLAAQSALRDGFGCNLSGGFHHAYPGHGEGFCAIHDVAVAIRRMQADGAIRKAIVVDADVHHGNGTAAIFRGDPSVFTLSIHQENNYPALKPPSTLDLHLADRVADEEYLEELLPAVEKALAEFAPQMLFYVGGADPYCEDQLGGLLLTKGGLQQRDREVFRLARMNGIPVVTTLAGGYARRVEDTVQIHCNTIIAAREVAGAFPNATAART